MVTTKHGNRYTNQEWQEMMTEWAREIQAGQAYLEAVEQIKETAAAKLVELAGVDEAKSYGIAHRIFEQGLDGIQFSSPENQQAVEQIERWMTAEERKVR